MKIGIITFHCANNYGAVLQAVALQKFVSDIFPDSEIKIINYRPKSIIDTYSVFYPIRISSSFLLKARRWLGLLLQLPFALKCKVSFSQFRRNHFHLINTSKLFDFDFIICGSDQIWNPVLTNGLDSHYFGHFINFTGKRIAYAVSDGGELFGVDNLPIKELLSCFSALSVRETSMLPLIQPLYDKSIISVLDPVFLPGTTFWNTIANDSKDSNYILLYQLAENPVLLAEAINIATKQNKRLIEVSYGMPFRSIIKKRRTVRVAVTPQDFLGYFKNADMILTNSFHGTAFSIIFRKQFFSFALSKRSSRMIDLLDTLALSNRYVNSCITHLHEAIDYTLVQRKLDCEIGKSKKYLINELSRSN